VFVLIATIVFYIILRFYKHTVENEKKNGKPKSNFIYILFLPTILYLTRFMYNENKLVYDKLNTGGDITGGDIGKNLITDVGEIQSSESLLSIPFPESSMSISSTV
jgi:hypothetical protein